MLYSKQIINKFIDVNPLTMNIKKYIIKSRKEVMCIYD